jgi:hypothetical protein
MMTKLIKITMIGAVACVAIGGMGTDPAFADISTPKVECSEACLRDHMDQYLQALASHDPSPLPVAPKVRFTEDGVQIPLGEALWVTVSSIGSYRHYFYDTSIGGVSAFVSITENGTPGFLMVRLKLVKGKITEIETVVDRDARTAAQMPAYEPIWDEKEPVEKRLTRQQLIEGTIGYMRALAFAKGSLAPFANSCIRLENGMVMALGPQDKPPVPLPTFGGGNADWGSAVRSTLGMGCTKQLDTRVYAFITEYDNPRFPIVDVERQIVFGIFNFRRRGTVKTVTMPDGKTYKMMPGTQWPNEVLNTEAWKYRDGKITRIEAVFLANRTYKTGTGWPGGRKGEKRTTD